LLSSDRGGEPLATAAGVAPEPIRLPLTLKAWGGESFAEVLLAELTDRAEGLLPLSEVACAGGLVEPASLSFSLLRAEAGERSLHLRLGLFFRETLGGCSCGDEPEARQDYREFDLRVDRVGAQARIHWSDA
jgi:hypothetical protein